jgi:hypothetical protein
MVQGHPRLQKGWLDAMQLYSIVLYEKRLAVANATEIAPTFGQEYYKVMRRAESGDKEALKNSLVLKKNSMERPRKKTRPFFRE